MVRWPRVDSVSSIGMRNSSLTQASYFYTQKKKEKISRCNARANFLSVPKTNDVRISFLFLLSVRISFRRTSLQIQGSNSLAIKKVIDQKTKNYSVLLPAVQVLTGRDGT
jgi:hypothetical protein